MCSSVHKELKNSYSISILRLVSKLQMLVYTVVKNSKELMMIFSMDSWNTVTCPGKKLCFDGCTNSWQTQKSTLYTFAFKKLCEVSIMLLFSHL